MESLASDVIGFVSANRDWAFWLALAIAAAETTALVSILIPSTAILVGIGALVATGALDFTPIWLGAAAGALLGSTFSWWLGLRFGQPILGLWPLSRHPELVSGAVAAFRRRGVGAVFVGHFVGPLRPVVFLMAGMSRIPLHRFTLWNSVGAVTWAFLVPKSGEVGGDVIGWLWAIVAGWV